MKISETLQTRKVPVDLLFFQRPAEDNGRGASYLPIVLYEPLKELFRSGMYDRDSVGSFYRWYSARRSLERLRKGLLVAGWRNSVRRQFRAFGSQLPVIDALNNDRLIIDLGVEAACVAKATGKTWMDVLMPSRLCNLWDRRPIEPFREMATEQKRKIFYNPILHEAFRHAKVERPESVRLDRIRRLLGGYGEGLKGIDIGCNMGYMSHMLERQGVKMVGIELNESHVAAAMALNTAYGLAVSFHNCCFEDYKPREEFSIALLLTVFYHTYNKGQRLANEMLRKIDAITEHALFWESGDHPEDEIGFIVSHSGFRSYLPLGRTHGTGKRREMGVFLKPDTELSKHLFDQHRIEFPDLHERGAFCSRAVVAGKGESQI